MNAFINVQIRVHSAAARKEIAALEAQMRSMNSIGGRASRAFSGFGNSALLGVTRLGNQVQWAGRQLQYNFSLPLAIAGGAATKFALDNERAMVRVIKVYGDGSEVFDRLAKTEIPALQRAFEALSNHFAVAQSDVINIAGDWAAAGASGIALAKSVRLTLETMILGELEAAEATEALIAVQAQYGFTVDELSKSLDVLNMIENETGISMAGLIQGFARSAGAARSAGIDVRHLGALLAALTPASGTAAQAGNALRTMMSRIMAPTKEAAEVMGLMGINTKDMAWQSMNGVQRLEAMAKSFNNLDDAQKIVVSSVVASRWQINRFDVLMRDITNTNGYYQKSLEATADSVKNLRQRQQELNAVLTSNPQMLKQTWVILQNAMARVVAPLLPYIVALAQAFVRWIEKFQNLSPEVQKLLGVLAIALILFGPMLRYLGSLITLFGYLSIGFHLVGTAAKFFVKELFMLAAWPFKAVGAGFGAISGALFKLLKPLKGVLIAWQATLRGIAITSVTVPAFLTRMFVAGFGAITAGGALWFRGMAALGTMLTPLNAAFQYFFFTTLPATMAAGMRGIRVIMFSLAMGVIPTIEAVLGKGGQAAGLAFAKGIWAVRMAISAVFTAMQTIALLFAGRLPVLVSTAMAGAAGAVATVGRAITVAWRAIILELQAIALVFSRGLPWMMSATMVATRNVVMVVGASIAAAWRVILFNMQVATVLFSRALPMLLVGGFARVRGAAVALIGFFVKWGKLFFRVLLGPWGLALTAALLLFAAFRDQLTTLWNGIVKSFQNQGSALGKAFAPVVNFFQKAGQKVEEAFWKLPKGIRDAMLAVVNIVKTAALKVYELFSYLNPFARHSPSLVESVTAGMAAIKDQYGSVGNVGAIFARAARDLKAFKEMASALGKGEWSEPRADVASALPAALPLFDALVGHLGKLNRLLAEQASLVSKQESVVATWEARLKAANAALDVQQKKLDGLEGKLKALEDTYASHEQAMRNYAQAPLKGLGAVEDAIFANELAQKKLRLELLKMGEEAGVDDLRSRLASLAGDIEKLRGDAGDLRSAGAGSDVLGPINAEIAKMEAQYAALEGSVSTTPVNELQKQLEELQRQGEIMDLERAINFDPLERQISKVVNGMKEMSFDQIINGVTRERAAMDALTPSIDAATAAVDRQKQVVDQLTAARDAVRDRYDMEKDKLNELQDAYRTTEDAIREIESALRDVSSASADALRKAGKSTAADRANKLSPGAQNFLDAEGGNFPEVGGFAKIGREGGLEDQSALIEEFTQQLTDETAGLMEGLDMFAPIKEKWNQFKDWWNTNVVPIWNGLVGGIGDAFGAAGFGDGFDGFKEKFSGLWDKIESIGSSIEEWWNKISDLFGPQLRELWTDLSAEWQPAIDSIREAFDKFKDIPLVEALKNAWNILKPILGVIAAGVIEVFSVIFSILGNILGPIITMISGILTGIIDIIRGVINIIVGIFTGDLKRIWTGVTEIFGGLGRIIGSLLRGLWDIVFGIVKGLVEGVVDFFTWLWDVLVGHSIIPDMVNAIIDWFKNLWDTVVSFVSGLVDGVVKFFQGLWDSLVKKVKGIYDAMNFWWNYIKFQIEFHVRMMIFKVAQFFLDLYNNIKTTVTNVANWLRDKWNNIKDTITRIATNIKDWVVERFTTLKDNVVNRVTTLRDKAVSIWENIKTKLRDAANWVKDQVSSRFTTLKDNILGAFNYVRDKIGGVFDKITGYIKSGINTAIKAVNKLIDGLNKVADILPGLDWKISAIPLLAAGGAVPSRRVGGGFETSGARAIVGEGKANYPEFVIPTDPTYRKRARDLYMQLGNRLGVDIAESEVGGPLDTLKAAGKGAVGLVKNVVGGAASKLLKPFTDKAQEFINGLQWRYGKDMASTLFNKVMGWAVKKDEEVPTLPGEAGAGAVGGGGWAAITAWLRKNSTVPFRITSTIRKGNPRSRHYSGLAVDLAAPTPSRDSAGLLAINQALLPIAKTLNELIYSGPGGQSFKAGRPHGYSASVRAMHHDHVHAAMQNGGIVKKSYGGRKVLVGEGGRDEAILPLPNDWPKLFNVLRDIDAGTLKRAAEDRAGGAARASRATATEPVRDVTVNNHTEYHFHGDLSFPNIKNGGDAEEFVRNLSDLAGV